MRLATLFLECFLSLLETTRGARGVPHPVLFYFSLSVLTPAPQALLPPSTVVATRRSAAESQASRDSTTSACMPAAHSRVLASETGTIDDFVVAPVPARLTADFDAWPAPRHDIVVGPDASRVGMHGTALSPEGGRRTCLTARSRFQLQLIACPRSVALS